MSPSEETMDKEDFSNCFVKYEELIHRIIAYRVKDYHDVQELCQQVFFKLYLNVHKIDADYVRAWLIHCTKNTICDYFRKVGRCKEVPLELVDDIRFYLDVEQIDRNIDMEKLLKDVVRVVKDTNDDWYELLKKNCFEGYSYSEIAKELSEDEDVLRARMYRMRTYIKKAFHDEELR